jgi:hypothetical protein
LSDWRKQSAKQFGHSLPIPKQFRNLPALASMVCIESALRLLPTAHVETAATDRGESGFTKTFSSPT